MSTVLTGAYKLRVTSRDPFAAVQEQIVFEELPAVPGEASAWWYQWQGTYVALFVVPELTAEPLCPGTSFLAEGTQIYTFITNSPTDEGACDDYPFSAEQLVEPPFGARRCGSLIVYHTTIPVGQSGQVWSSIEQYSGDIVLGVTGRAETDGPPPDLNPQAAAYDFGEGTELDGVLPPGESVVTC